MYFDVSFVPGSVEPFSSSLLRRVKEVMPKRCSAQPFLYERTCHWAVRVKLTNKLQQAIFLKFATVFKDEARKIFSQYSLFRDNRNYHIYPSLDSKGQSCLCCAGHNGRISITVKSLASPIFIYFPFTVTSIIN